MLAHYLKRQDVCAACRRRKASAGKRGKHAEKRAALEKKPQIPLGSVLFIQ
jgi:hypothetical protein